jgi:hypothetical protein
MVLQKLSCDAKGVAELLRRFVLWVMEMMSVDVVAVLFRCFRAVLRPVGSNRSPLALSCLG